MKVLLFGTGDYYERFKKWFVKEEVLALLDNSPAKQNTEIDGVPVVSPQEGVKIPFDCIVILSFYVKAMRKQLLELGVGKEKIYHFYDLHCLFQDDFLEFPVVYYENSGNLTEIKKMKFEAAYSDKKKNRIVLLSQDLTLGGPALALFQAAKVLKKNGYDVIYASMLDGPLREKILLAGIPVVVDVNLQVRTMREMNWLRGASLIFCNTINFHVFLSERYVQVPAVWWLHDSGFFYDGVNSDLLRKMDPMNLNVVSVGPVPKRAIHRFVPDLEVGSLLYGVPDVQEKESFMEHNSLIFAVIGYIEERKGQDILVKAIKRIPGYLRQQAKFLFVGPNTSALARQIKREVCDIPEIRMTGPVSRQKIDEILEEADMLVCPSREDPMPTVAAEAMMHWKPCLISDASGTAEYLTDGKDGLIFESENVEELSQKLIWSLKNKKKLKEMGKQARKIYDTVFSMEVFEKNLLSLTEAILKKGV